jgi:putative hydrolase
MCVPSWNTIPNTRRLPSRDRRAFPRCAFRKRALPSETPPTAVGDSTVGTLVALRARMRLNEDVHIHSTFSDGAGTLLENLRMAEARGLRCVVCVDLARADSHWVRRFVDEVRAARTHVAITVSTGIEVRFLSPCGELDLPSDLWGVDYLYASDHRLPIDRMLLNPAEAMRALVARELTPARVIGALVDASIGALERYPRVILAHPFSFLSRVGVSEELISNTDLERLGSALQRYNGSIEVNERWRCPSARVVRALSAQGVTIRASSNSHSPETIGQYAYVRSIAQSLRRAA